MKNIAIAVSEVIDSGSATAWSRSSLRKRGVARLRARKDARLTCTSGRLWATRAGDPRDYLLAAGESLPLDLPLVVEALDEGSYSVA